MQDFERILENNWQRRRRQERKAAAKREWAAQQEKARKRAGRYEVYRGLCILASLAAGTGVGAAVLLGRDGMPLESFAVWVVTCLVAALAVAFDELREENRND